MKKYLYVVAFGISLTVIGFGGYLIYAQNQQLEARVNVLEKRVEELTTPVTEQNEEKQTLYQRLQTLDNKVGEWIKNH